MVEMKGRDSSTPYVASRDRMQASCKTKTDRRTGRLHLGISWCCLAIMGSLPAPSQANGAERYQAWLDETGRADRIAIQRNGSAVRYVRGFHACDVVSRIDSEAADHANVDVIIVTLGGQRVSLTGSRSYTIPCSRGGVGANVLAFMEGVMRLVATRQKSVSAAGRGSCDGSGSGLAMPVIPRTRRSTMITESRQQYHFRWSGGLPPYAIEIRSLPRGDEAEGVVAMRDMMHRAITVPIARLRPGHYTFTLSDACSTFVVDYDLHVVAESERPSLPGPLKGSDLSEVERAIWYANYLVSIDEGQWQVEAMQLVARVPQQDDPRVKGWLAQWGDPDM